MDYDRIQDAIHRCILYNERVLNFKYPKLTDTNEQLIVGTIVKDHHEKFSELISKKDYYDTALFSWIQEIVKHQAKKTIPDLPDPSYIANRYHATSYVKQIILKDDMKVRAIRELIFKHKAFEDDFMKQREAIINHFNEKKSSILHKEGPEVLINVKESQISRLRQETETNLRRLEDKMAFKMKSLGHENCELLFGLKVPFFNIDNRFKYPDLKQDQEFMLDFLRDNILSK